MPLKKFPGDLGKRIPKGTSYEDVDRFRLEREQLLVKHYGLENVPPIVRHELLAWHLACDFVPGFKVDRRGRNQASDAYGKESVVYKAVQNEFSSGIDNLKEACQRIRYKKPFQDWDLEAPELEKMYRRLEKRLESGIATRMPPLTRPGRHKKRRTKKP